MFIGAKWSHRFISFFRRREDAFRKGLTRGEQIGFEDGFRLGSQRGLAVASEVGGSFDSSFLV